MTVQHHANTQMSWFDLQLTLICVFWPITMHSCLLAASLIVIRTNWDVLDKQLNLTGNSRGIAIPGRSCGQMRCLPVMGLSSPLSLEVPSHATQAAGQGSSILLLFFLSPRAAQAGTGAVWSMRLQLGRRGMPWPPQVEGKAVLFGFLMAVCSKGNNTDNFGNSKRQRQRLCCQARFKRSSWLIQACLWPKHVCNYCATMQNRFPVQLLSSDRYMQGKSVLSRAAVCPERQHRF